MASQDFEAFTRVQFERHDSLQAVSRTLQEHSGDSSSENNKPMTIQNVGFRPFRCAIVAAIPAKRSHTASTKRSSTRSLDDSHDAAPRIFTSGKRPSTGRCQNVVMRTPSSVPPFPVAQL